MPDKLHGALDVADGIHSAEAFPAAADEAARIAVVQASTDRGKVIYQTDTGFWYMAKGTTGEWQLIGDGSGSGGLVPSATVYSASFGAVIGEMARWSMGATLTDSLPDPSTLANGARHAVCGVADSSGGVLTVAAFAGSTILGSASIQISGAGTFALCVIEFTLDKTLNDWVISNEFIGAILGLTGPGAVLTTFTAAPVATIGTLQLAPNTVFGMLDGPDPEIIPFATISGGTTPPDPYVGWRGDQGKTVVDGEVTAWASGSGSAAAPLVLALPGAPILDATGYVEAVYDGEVSGAWLYAEGDDDAFASVDDDNYLQICMSVQSADVTDVDAGFWLFNDDFTSVVFIGYLNGSAVAMYLPDMQADPFDLSNPGVVVQEPMADGLPFTVELWSDGANIKACINGGIVGSLAWSGNKWPDVMSGQTIAAGNELDGSITARFYEFGVVRDAYIGAGAALAWRDAALSHAAAADSGGAGGAVSSVFGRMGAVVATLADYAASLISNDSGVVGSTVKDALETLATAIAGKANTSHAHAAGDLTSGTLADARVAASNVTQHVGSLVHQSLSGAGTNTHGQIDTHLGITAGNPHGATAGQVPFTPDGDIAAATVQAAIVEVRNDTDTKVAGAKAQSMIFSWFMS